MKIIFLDLDGVLNSAAYFKSLKDKGIHQDKILNSLEPGMVERLNKIIDRTGAKVVISSTWRKLHSMDELKAFLVEFGFRYVDNVIDVTPTMNTDRGLEIHRWLTAQKERLSYDSDPITHFCIIDDNNDMVLPYLLSRFVWTTWDDGMEDNHVEKAIETLESIEFKWD